MDHLHGHVVASTLRPDPIEAPYLCLVASGGHTFLARVDDPGAYTVLGQTLDDAAGEAFDKGARMLGLPYPGGPELDRLARDGDPDAFDFPRSRPGDALDFSFSGAEDRPAVRHPRPRGGAGGRRAGPTWPPPIQRAIVAALIARVAPGGGAREASSALAIGGGVAANSELRARLTELRGRPGGAPVDARRPSCAPTTRR